MKKLIATLLAAVLCISFVHADSSSSDYRIMINTASRILKLYKSDTLIKEFPIAVGKPTTKSPLGSFRIISKTINPWWGNHGNPMPPGPNNPLGIRWMGISAPRGGYGIHGNSTPSSIGTFASGGCIRMFNSDVEKLFSIVSIGTPVQIVYENLELKLDKYTNAPVLMVYPNMYKQKTAEALLKKFRAENSAISEQQAAKALKLANSGITKAVAVSEGTTLIFNNQFVTNDTFVENGEVYIYSLAALDCFGLDSDTIGSLNIKTYEKNGLEYINMTEAASKIGIKTDYDKNNNNIYITGSLVKVNGRFLNSYNGGFDKEYSFNRTALLSIGGDIVPASSTKQAVDLKNYTKERKWTLNADSLLKVMNINIPLKVKADGKLFDTIYWGNKYYLNYDALAGIPGMEAEAMKFSVYNNVKYIDLDELLKVYEYKTDSFFTVVELIKPLSINTEDQSQTDAGTVADKKDTAQ